MFWDPDYTAVYGVTLKGVPLMWNIKLMVTWDRNKVVMYKCAHVPVFQDNSLA
jgi:hypothetical protein